MSLGTPTAQCIGERDYRYCVVPQFGGMSLALAAREVREFLSPARIVTGDGTARTFVAIDRASPLQLSALRAGPEGSIVLRMFAPRGETAESEVRFASPVRDVRSVDLREGETGLGNTGLDVIRTAAPPEIVGGALRVRLAPYEIGTFLVMLA
ncbi:MAG: glycosyl hydrolase-related protein [Chloroflexota bacterium]